MILTHPLRPVLQPALTRPLETKSGTGGASVPADARKLEDTTTARRLEDGTTYRTTEA